MTIKQILAYNMYIKFLLYFFVKESVPSLQYTKLETSLYLQRLQN